MEGSLWSLEPRLQRGALATSSKGELGGEGNMANAILPLVVHRFLTSGPLDMMSSSCGGIHKRSLSFPSAVGPTYVGLGGKLTLEEHWRVGKWGVYLETGSRLRQF